MTTKTILEGTNGKLAPLDSVSGAQAVIQYFHNSIHEGIAYEASLLSEGVADDAFSDMLIQTNTACYTHIIIDSSADADYRIELYEGTVVTSTGTVVDSWNKNRTVPASCAINIFSAPVVSDVSSRIAFLHVPGGAGGSAVGGHKGLDDEWVLQLGTNYLFRLVNKGGQASTLWNHLDFIQVAF